MKSEENDLQLKMVRWRCNRGMLELDLLLIPFVEKHFVDLNDDEKKLFIELLTYEDPELFAWLMGHEEVTVEELKPMINLIKNKRVK